MLQRPTVMMMKQNLSYKLVLSRLNNYIATNLKNRSDTILRLWAAQCENIVAQRFRRGQQVISLYAKIWEDRALKELFFRLRRQVHRHAKGLMLGSVGVYAFDWDSERITLDSIRMQFDEMDNIRRLQKDSIICSNCNRRKIIDCRVEGIVYCTCSKEILKYAACEDNEWKPYLERKNMIVWRREERPGLYAYKVYASYPDVSADDFLFVQTDTAYRKVWDKSAITLEVVDNDPTNITKSQVIYWEMLWPKLFANRDYVFNRRYLVDNSRKMIVIANKSIVHPCCPVKPNNQRVREYWSYMVIKPSTNNFKKPGLEYVLTYFDNPGVVLPPAVTSWVAQKQMPDFLNKLYCATLEYAKQRKEDDVVYNCWDRVLDPGFEYPPDPTINYEESDSDDRGDDGSNGSSRDKSEKDNSLDEQMDEVDTAPKKSSWWSYLLPYHYFA
ncbi:hypothetical protein HA402_008318 [Bradysia odoriphaga]|nr:hypothetical protein HA402_008318 [Bradysia odoriphaga]